ncbi:hypothetical protein [Pedobacter sp. NJ-S-72]
MAKNPDLSALAAYAGTYQQSLFTRLYNGFDAAKDLTLWTGVKNKTNATKLVISGSPKQGTGVFRPKKGDIGYKPRVIEAFPWQRDLEITPSQYRESFMAAMRGSGENPNNKVIPFAGFLWNTVTDDLAESMNNRSVYFGVGTGAFSSYNPSTAYSPGIKVSFVGFDGGIDYYESKSLTTPGQSPLTNPELWIDRNAEAIMVGYGKLISDEIVIGAAAAGLDPVQLLPG